VSMVLYGTHYPPPSANKISSFVSSLPPLSIVADDSSQHNVHIYDIERHMETDEDGSDDEDLMIVMDAATRVTSLIRIIALRRRQRVEVEEDDSERQARISRSPPVDFRSMMSTLIAEGMFYQEVGLTPGGFEDLVRLLGPALQVDSMMATARSVNAPLSAGERLYLTLRYLKGGAYPDIRRERSIARSQFYRIRDNVLLALWVAVPDSSSLENGRP